MPPSVANFPHGGIIRGQPVGYDRLRTAISLHQVLEEFQRGTAVTSLGRHCLQDFNFVVGRPPQIMGLAVDLHEHALYVTKK